MSKQILILICATALIWLSACGRSATDADLLAGIQTNDVAAVQFALDAGADPSAMDDDGQTALLLSIGHDECMRALLDAGADVQQRTQSEFMTTPLEMAIAVDDLDAARLLLEAGADPNEPNPATRHTPLGLAIANSSPELVQLLIQHEVNPDTEIDGIALLAIAEDRLNQASTDQEQAAAIAIIESVTSGPK